VRLIDDKGMTTMSKELKEYKDGEILNTLSFDFEKGEMMASKSEVVKEKETKEFFKVELEDGRIINCTMNHKLFVKREKRIIELQLKDIKEGDELVCI